MEYQTASLEVAEDPEVLARQPELLGNQSTLAVGDWGDVARLALILADGIPEGPTGLLGDASLSQGLIVAFDKVDARRRRVLSRLDWCNRLTRIGEIDVLLARETE